MRINMLECSVDDYVFNAVLAICGEETAWKLCYEDHATYQEAKAIVDTILDGNLPGGKPKEAHVS